MAKEFYIPKKSGTYAETLEAFGVTNLVNEIFAHNNQQGYKITIKDKKQGYLVETNIDVTDNLIQNLPYFQVIKFIKKDANQEIPEGINDYFDYPKNKALQDEYNERYKQIQKIKSEEDKKSARKALNAEKISEYGSKIDAEYNVYREICKNPYETFLKAFNNIHSNQTNFKKIITHILNFYAGGAFQTERIDLIDKKPTAHSLFNPACGKGLNKDKASGASVGNIKSNWIPETMKILGAYKFMICQYTKVGSGTDFKIYVPEFNVIGFSEAQKLTFEFKKYLRQNSPIKLDIINSCDFMISFIKHTPEYRGKVNKAIKGFHSVYQKKLGGPTKPGTVTNIGFINIPNFVNIFDSEQGQEWIQILEDQRNLIFNIKEQGDAIQGLQEYRNFLGSVGPTASEYFANFSYWYAGYLMQQLAKGNRFVRTFKIDYLTKFYSNMDTQELNLKEIIQNDGFQAVAKAIRKSTVTLQYTPKEQRKFEIRYGLAQQLQNKAKSKEDLATFIGEFIGTYNAETARNAEKNGGKVFRANVKDDELIKFYSLLDSNPPRLVGALLASYGFALNKKEVKGNEEIDYEETEQEEN